MDKKGGRNVVKVSLSLPGYLLDALDTYSADEGLSRSRAATVLLRDALIEVSPLPVAKALLKAEREETGLSREEAIAQLRAEGVPIPDE